VSGLDVKFKDIIYQYRKQPQCHQEARAASLPACTGPPVGWGMPDYPADPAERAGSGRSGWIGLD
jgi:hypothetical protein